jgi:hypothetical protein
MARSSRRLTGNRNLHRAKSYESALNRGIPVYSIFTHTSDFVQTQNEAKILTASKKKSVVSSDEDSDVDEDAVAMLAKNFERFMKNNKFKKKFSTD